MGLQLEDLAELLLRVTSLFLMVFVAGRLVGSDLCSPLDPLMGHVAHTACQPGTCSSNLRRLSSLLCVCIIYCRP